jgi:magnesium chelatase subunit D
MQHGRNAVQYAQFVIISDGRGNVPLEASHAGKITRSVNREGVDDALQVAQQIHSLDNVKTVLFNPQPQQYAELPLTLARALRAKTILIPLQEAAKV